MMVRRIISCHVCCVVCVGSIFLCLRGQGVRSSVQWWWWSGNIGGQRLIAAIVVVVTLSFVVTVVVTSMGILTVLVAHFN